MKKNRKKVFLSFVVIVAFVFSWSLALAQYTNQEKIPGAQPTQIFEQYLKDIINFGFATIGILALFMIVIGAYQYLMAAGNIGKVDSARETIGSALLGLILGLCAWIILYKINPDLVEMKLVNISQISTPSGTQQPGTPGKSTKNCDPNLGNCQTSKLGCFGADAERASRVCGYESQGGNPFALSGTDFTKNGKPFSAGLFQLNLTVHDLDMGCTKAFSGGINSSATVTDDDLYRRCVSKAQDEQFNIAYACRLYKNRGNNFGDWSNTVNTCGI